MKIIEDFLTVNEFSRPGKKLKEVLAVVMHWTANPGVSAKNNRNYFEALKNGKSVYASAHYIVGLEGEVLQCIPDNEVAYHCGTSSRDPKSGKVYTDLARKMFGKYAAENNSPNNCTIGIELCPINNSGEFKAATLESAREFTARLLKKHKLDTSRIVTHHEVVGWKDCPRLWTDSPELFHDFVLDVAEKMRKIS